MHKLRHFYYQNKEKIWKVVLIIAFLLGIIYYLNYTLIKNQNEANANTVLETPTYSNEQTNTYISDKSAISGETVTKQEVETINKTISQFLQYCKNGQTETAYSMLSADCKENEYNTLEKFQQRYVKTKFNKDDIYEIENWINNTYKISMSKDILATGDLNSSKQIEYITIVKENGQEKLNINSYIGKKMINKEQIENGVKVTVLSKRVHMDYETYDFKIENLSNKTIKLDSLETTGTIYLEDKNENKYKSYSHELYSDELEIKAKNVVNISIKYVNTYSNKTEIEKIVFEKVILDYIEYKKQENVAEFKDICELAIDL